MRRRTSRRGQRRGRREEEERKKRARALFFLAVGALFGCQLPSVAKTSRTTRENGEKIRDSGSERTVRPLAAMTEELPRVVAPEVVERHGRTSNKRKLPAKCTGAEREWHRNPSRLCTAFLNIRSLNRMRGSINWRHEPLSSASARSSSHERSRVACKSPVGNKSVVTCHTDKNR